MALPRNTAVFRRDAPRYIGALMRDFGLTDVQAAGFPGNFGVESAGFTQMQELRPAVKGSKGGLGPAQWTGPRRRSYEAWLKRKGATPGNFEADYGFLFRELVGPEAGVLAPLRKAQTIEQAVRIVMEKYERPGVPHLDRRVEWGELALSTFRARQDRPAAPAPAPAPIPVVDAHPAPAPEGHPAPPPVARPWWLPAAFWRRLVPAAAAPAPAEEVRGDPVIYRVQRQLSDMGYGEVGQVDGVYGPKTRTALKLFRDEQARALEIPFAPPLAASIVAAVAAGRAREVPAERANATAATMRAAGSTPIRTLDGFKPVAWLSGLLGLGGAAKDSGLLDGLQRQADSALETMHAAQSLVMALLGLVNWAVQHWYIFAGFGGVYVAWRVFRGVVEVVGLFRRNILGQASA